MHDALPIIPTLFGRPFVKRFALCYQTVVCLSCLSCPVCDINVLWLNGWMHQDETLHAGRPRPWPHCVRWGVGTQLPSPKGGGGTAPIGPYLLWPSQWQDGSRCQLAREVGLSPSDTVLDRDPALPAKGEQHPPRLFSAHVYCGHGRQHL